MKIYTKTGDLGETGLWGRKKVPKNHKIIEALGTIDELSANLGLINGPKIEKIQQELQTINSAISGFKTKVPDVGWLEKEIDRMQTKLPELKNFILPKGQIHVARAVCRRAERRVVDPAVGRDDAVKYLNRLSDYLFVLARWIAAKSSP